MKRVKTIKADDGETSVEVTLAIKTRRGALTRHEQDTLLRSTASAIVTALADQRYLGCYVADIKVE